MLDEITLKPMLTTSEMIEHLKEKNIKFEQMSEKSDITYRTLESYEQGLRKIDGAKIETLLKISNTLDCPIYEFIEDNILAEKIKEIYNYYTTFAV